MLPPRTVAVLPPATGLIVKLQDFVLATELASVTRSVKLDAPLPVGVPAIELPEMLKPAGSGGTDRSQVDGNAPPELVSTPDPAVLYETPCVPAGSGQVVVTIGAALTTIDGDVEALLLPPSVTEILVLNVVAALTVPVRVAVVPVCPLQFVLLNPVGIPAHVHVSAPPPQLFAEAVMVEMVCPTVYGPGEEGDSTIEHPANWKAPAS
jgi:hypothetical protein